MGAYGSPELFPNDNKPTYTAKNAFIYCSNCGERYSKKLKFCPNCKTRNPHIIKRNILLGFIIAIAAIMLIIIIIPSPTSRSGTSNVKIAEKSEDEKQREQEQYTHYSQDAWLSFEEYSKLCSGYDYNEILNNADSHKTEKITLSGVVLSIDNSGNKYALIVQSGTDVFFVKYYRYHENETPILQNDLITIYGELDGLITYQTIEGVDKTVPLLNMVYWNTYQEPQQIANVPTEYTTALKKAETYVNYMHMSKAKLYDQLTSEYGEAFSAEAAQYAVDNVKADWKQNALKSAETYQDVMYMSPTKIREQLVSEYGDEFTDEEADYAMAHLK